MEEEATRYVSVFHCFVRRDIYSRPEAIAFFEIFVEFV